MPSAAKRLYASTLELQYSACVSPYKCLLHIFMLYGYLSLAALEKHFPSFLFSSSLKEVSICINKKTEKNKASSKMKVKIEH